MTDIAVTWVPQDFRADWSIAKGDLQVGNDLQTAVVISLFTDRIASADFATDDRRGWWADTYETSPIGSRLWQLMRAKKSGAYDVLNRAKDYCKEALQWLLDDGVAATINIDTFWIRPNVMGISVVIIQPDRKTRSAFQFDWAWNGV